MSNVYINFTKEFNDRATKIITTDQLRRAMIKRDEMKDEHIIVTLGKLNYLDNKKCHEILADIVKENKLSNIHICSRDSDEVTLDTNGNYFYGMEQVEIAYYINSSNADSSVCLMPYGRYMDFMRRKSGAEQDKDSEGIDKPDVPFTFKDVVRQAISKDTSDIHIMPTDGNYFIYFRINGQFLIQDQFLLSREQGRSLNKLMLTEAANYTKGKFSSEEYKVSQDAKIEYDDLNADIRLSFVPDGRSLIDMDVTARVQVRKTIGSNETLEEKMLGLGIDDKDVDAWRSISQQRAGLVVVSGITNSGKSTTLVNVISTIKDKKVGTIEDPIEYTIGNTNVVQHQLYEPDNKSNSKIIKMGFSEYVKSFKRGDYDAILIGEWRQSKELAESIIEQSYAGQMIYTTLHIGSAFEIYKALDNMYNIPTKITTQLIMLSWNQMLAPKLCSKCREEHSIHFSSDEVKFLSKYDEDEKNSLVNFKTVGCKRSKDGCIDCNHTGYEGRALVYEYFVPSQGLTEQVVKDNLQPHEIKKKVVKDGSGRTKLDVFLSLLRRGDVEKEFLFKL